MNLLIALGLSVIVAFVIVIRLGITEIENIDTSPDPHDFDESEIYN